MKGKEKTNSGFKLEVFNFCIILLTVTIVLTLSVIIIKAHKTYDEFQAATDEYISCREAAEQIHKASDDLTKAVRDFANDCDVKNMNAYFDEAQNRRNRQKALDIIMRYDSSNGKNESLVAAVNSSMELMNIEYYSMRLVLEATDVPEASYPDEIKLTILNDTDKNASPTDKLDKARAILYDSDYNRYKAEIYDYISDYTDDILDGTKEREKDNSRAFSVYLDIQITLVILLLCILTVNVSFTSIFMIRPLRKSSKLIVNQELLPEKGVTEMRTFARLYNKVLEKTKSHQAELSYEASHDSLTGIYNRSAFDDLYRTMHSTDGTVLLLIDIDSFKGINDNYGHETGDAVLKRVAAVLHSSFRTDDVICRIGGDEFTVILSGVTNECRDQLENKAAFIMNKLAAKEDGIPEFTLSIGIAFGDKSTSFKTLYNNADKALYAVKTSTKNGVKFYN